MSSFNNNGITQKGASIIASAIAGDTLTFTRIIVGDGVLPSGQTVLTTESLVNPLFDVPISSVESDGGNIATVKGAFSNDALTVGFFYREIGLYAIDPVTNAEVLYCYGNAGDTAEWINPVGESSLVEKEIHLVTLVGNATTVTAVFDKNSFALQSEINAKLPLKADLDAEGGRVLASQMRFEEKQTLYVDVSASAGGDGTEARPFKTIQAAVDARYRGCNHVQIFINAGDYDEAVNVGNAAGTAWTFARNGSGAVMLKSITIGACNYASVSNLTFNAIGGESSLSLTNVSNAYINNNTFNGSGNNTAVVVSLSNVLMYNNAINNAATAVKTLTNAYVRLRDTSGTGNTIGIDADTSMIVGSHNTLTAETKYVRTNGAVIAMEGGESSFPSNYSQTYYLGVFGTIEELRAALLAEFDKLNDRERRICSFANSVADGVGPFHSGQNMYVEIMRNSSQNGGFGVVFIRSHFEPAAGYWIVQNGTFITDVPKAFAVVETATPIMYGLVRVAAVDDEVNPTVEDAALTPANLFRMANYRISETKYAVGDIVGVPYHAEFIMQCTTAGKTSAEILDTTNVTAGETITDGGVKWKVIANGVIDAKINGKVITLTFADGTTQTLTTQDTTQAPVCFGTCTTAKTTNAKVATITSGSFTLEAGRIVVINFSNDLTNSAHQTSDEKITLNVNSSGAKKIRTEAGNKTSTSEYLTNWCHAYKGSYVFCYDGTDWLMLNNTYIGWTDWNNAGT